jgi:hypothetical protein
VNTRGLIKNRKKTLNRFSKPEKTVNESQDSFFPPNLQTPTRDKEEEEKKTCPNPKCA